MAHGFGFVAEVFDFRHGAGGFDFLAKMVEIEERLRDRDNLVIVQAVSFRLSAVSKSKRKRERARDLNHRERPHRTRVRETLRKDHSS